MKPARLLAALLSASLLAAPSPASAWGARGHELVAEAAVRAFPTSLPGFLRTQSARDAIIILSREPDRSRGAGRAHDYDRDPGHYIDLDDAGKIEGMYGLDQLPVSRADMETGLVVQGLSPNAAGYLPYALIDGFQQLAKDFAYWRASKVGAQRGATAADRAWFAVDMRVREQVIIRDIGVWGHYIGDGSQPQHVSSHHAGWDRFPDPMTYPPPGQPAEVRTVHNWFEGPFVKTNIRLADVQGAMVPYREAGPIERRVPQYLMTTWSQLEPLYRIITAGGLRDATPAAKSFTAARMAAGASEMRDLVEDAWKLSATMSVGYPNIAVADIEAGRVTLTKDSYGFD
jgi:hypothetical protein